VGSLTRHRLRAGAAMVATTLALAGCSTGKDAAVPGGGVYTFTAPGGQTKIFYDPPDKRGRLPELSGENVVEQGHQVRLSDYADKVVVINIWGSWCGPCRAETPQLEKVFEQTTASGVQFLGIDVRDTRTDAADFIHNDRVTYPSIFDPPGRTLLALQGYPRNVVPSTLVLDRQHRVAAVYLTALQESDLLPIVRRIAAEDHRGGTA